MREKSSSKRKRGSWMMMVLLLCVLPATSSCKKQEQEKPEVVRPAKLMTLETPGLYRDLSYPGRVKAFQEADLSFLVSGRLLEIPIRRGESVKKGQVLARVDDEDYRNQYNAANAYAEERKVYMGRVKEAMEGGGATEAEFDEAARTYDVAKARRDIAHKAVDDAILRAPFDGEIGRQLKESFQDVSAKETILRLQDVSKLKIVIDVPESIRILARRTAQESQGEKDPGSKTYVVFEDLPDEQFAVEYYEDERTGDPLTQTYAVTFVMPAPEPGLILPGMSATLKGRLKLKTPKSEPGFYVPVSAVISGPGTDRFVWVQDVKTQKVHKRQVKVAAVVGDEIEIIGGLKVGETIATSGAHHLREGMKVRPLVFKPGRDAG